MGGLDAIVRLALRRSLQQIAKLRWRWRFALRLPTAAMASVSGWQLDRVSPAGGSVAGTIVITLYGAGLDLLSQVIYRPKYLNKPLRVLSPTEAQVDFPCADLGVGALLEGISSSLL